MQIKKSFLIKILLYALAILIFMFSITPFLVMISTSLKPNEKIFTESASLISSSLTFEHYMNVFKHTNFLRYFLNSTIVALGTTVIGIIISIFASYAFSRFNFPGSTFFLFIILAVQMFPLVVLIIPLFIIMREFNLMNTYMGLIITYITFSLPFCIWMLKGFFDGIPFSLEEAAMIDGCNQFTAFIRVILPIAGPGIAATSIYSFILGWNEFMFALTFINDKDMRTLPLALNSFFGRFAVEWGSVMAASFIFTIPTMIFFLLVQQKIKTGLASGAVKG